MGPIRANTSQWPIWLLITSGFNSLKWLEWDAFPSQGYPPVLDSPIPIYTPGWRGTVKAGQARIRTGSLDPEVSALTMRPPRSPQRGGTIEHKGNKNRQDGLWKTRQREKFDNVQLLYIFSWFSEVLSLSSSRESLSFHWYGHSCWTQAIFPRLEE